MAIDNTCTSCFKTFTTTSGLRAHCRAKGHPFCVCEPCERSFGSEMALANHMGSPRHRDDDNDSDSSDASYDCLDGRDSDDSSAYGDDSDDSEDETEPFCDGCNRAFADSFALHQHLHASPKHNWCFTCSRDFSSENALNQHLESLAHRGRDFQCPFCESMFKSPSGIALHIEAGCHKFTRHHVTAAVRSMKIVPNIAIKRITGPPTVSSTVQTFIASEASFNGKSYACFLCKKKCRTLAGLNSHLNSAAHDDDEFRCPKCKAEFKLISGFVQHLESRACGLAKDKQVEKYYNNLTNNFSRLLKM